MLESTPAFERLLHAQFLMPAEAGRYQFAHDRIHQAAYSLIDEQERPTLHLRIGRMLQAAAGAEEVRSVVMARFQSGHGRRIGDRG